MPPSPMLSPMFNPQEFFLPEELLPPKKRSPLEAQAANMENADNTNRNPKPREAPVARKCSYKEFMRFQHFNFKGSEGAVGLICWFERTESVFSCSNCIEDCKTEETYKLSWVEFKKLLIKKYCPRTEVQKMEDEFYHLTVKGNDLKTYRKRALCKSVPKDHQQQCPGKILHAKGHECSPRPECSYGYVPSKSTSS
nr:reverse transcriptase domain-containing protein [Tanacetum cinerariifolium]